MTPRNESRTMDMCKIARSNIAARNQVPAVNENRRHGIRSRYLLAMKAGDLALDCSQEPGT